jgi:hypothetical protein
MMKWMVTALAIASALIATSVSAMTPIGDLRRNVDATISGVVRSVVGNEFILDDGTGQIIVDAGPDWYHDVDLRIGEELTISGEYDDYDFDAFRITRNNGQVIIIRSSDGPPPWAGQRRN